MYNIGRFCIGKGDKAPSLKLFNAVLEVVFSNFEWDTVRVNISGSLLSHIRLANDLVLIARDPTDSLNRDTWTQSMIKN